MASPNSYKDPYWSDLAAKKEKEVGIPDGLLSSILTHGEKSNANQVSEKGAKTPFQITPPTRKAIIDKYGIDPYLSDDLAAEGAALLLKESLDRNNGDPVQAAGEYIGGVNRENWGPKTQAYMKRVSSGMEEKKIAAMSDGFASWIAENKATLPEQESTKVEEKPLPEPSKSATGESDVPLSESSATSTDLSTGFGQWIANQKALQQQAQQQASAQQPEPSLGERLTGAGEAGLSTLTGVTGGTLGMAAGATKGIAESILDGTFGTQQAAYLVEQKAMQGAEALTYAPRTPTGQQYTQNVGEVMQQAIPVTPFTAELVAIGAGSRLAAPGLAAAARQAAEPAVMAATKAAQSGKALAGKAMEVTGLREPVAAPGSGRNAGAASVQMDTIRADKAANLPEPVTLTRGAETRDPAQLAFEKEQMKGSLGAPLRNRAEENNLQVLANFDHVVDATGGAAHDLASAGNSVVKALSDGLKSAKNETNIAYAKAKNSPEANAVVDPSTAVSIGEGENAITGSLIDYLNSKVTGVPSSAVPDAAKKIMIKMGIAEEDEAGNLVGRPSTVRQMEDLRKELTGSAKWDDRVGVREETIIKRLIDAQTEPVAGPLYQKARALRAAQARKYENRAIVARLITNRKGMDDPRVAVDQVFRASVLNGSPEEITFLKRVLNTSGEQGQQAWKDLKAATVQHIRNEATKGMGMDSADNPLVSPAKLHQVVNSLDKNGRLDIMLGKKNADVIRDLNDVVRYVNTVPPGTLINNSGTAGTILAAMGEAGTMGALTGLPVPVLTTLRLLSKEMKNARMRAKIKHALNLKPKY